MTSLAATVILYNPDEAVLHNIHSYYHHVNLILAIDNSEIPSKDFIDSLTTMPKIMYIANAGNQGMAHALNVAANKAIELGYKWLLTMDQDSSFDSDMLTHYVQCWNTYHNKANVAIFSPVHTPVEQQMLFTEKCEIHNTLQVMTSGNLLNLPLFTQLNGFNEALFIDEVDHEYCLRSKLAGFFILEFPTISLNHNLGESILIRRHNQTIQSSTHSPQRFYYIARNRLYMWKNYHHLFPNLVEIHFISIMKTLLFPLIYHDKKIQRFFFILRGIVHFLTGRYGK